MSTKFQITVEEAFKLGVVEGQLKAFKELKQFEGTNVQFIQTYLQARIAGLETALEIIRSYNQSGKGVGDV